MTTASATLRRLRMDPPGQDNYFLSWLYQRALEGYDTLAFVVYHPVSQRYYKRPQVKPAQAHVPIPLLIALCAYELRRKA